MSHSPDCRILCVSANADQAFAIIHRIKVLTDAASLELPSVDSSSPECDGLIPWTIVNKYYSADVHFQVQTLDSWNVAESMAAVPAILFIWTLGEPWKQLVQQISKSLKRRGCEPEVALAIRIRPAGSAGDDTEEEGVDDFLSQLGFEFIDARGGGARESHNHTEPDSNDIPDLPRVLDALSTIMWPSMKSTTSKRKTQVELDAWAHSSLDFEPAQEEAQASKMQDNLAKLERWLESDFPLSPHESDPWMTDEFGEDHPLAIVTSPREVREFTFDDDFAAFISVSSPSAHPDDDNDLAPMHTGASYASLGSLSNFEEESDEIGDDDDLLPTSDEIQVTSERIFGRTWGFPPTSTFEPWEQPSPSEDEMAAFDLGRVLSALDGMKAEIAEIKDDDERRKAAARVTLGLVHGLEIGGPH